MNDITNVKELINEMEEMHSDLYVIFQKIEDLKTEIVRTLPVGYDSYCPIDDDYNIMNTAFTKAKIGVNNTIKEFEKAISIIKSLTPDPDIDDNIVLDGWNILGECELTSDNISVGDTICLKDIKGIPFERIATCVAVKNNYADLMYVDCVDTLRIIRLINNKLYSKL